MEPGQDADGAEADLDWKGAGGKDRYRVPRGEDDDATNVGRPHQAQDESRTEVEVEDQEHSAEERPGADRSGDGAEERW